MQSRSCFNSEKDVAVTDPFFEDSNQDIFNQSTQKLNICGQTQNYLPKFVNNISLTSSSLQANTSVFPPKILKITPNICALNGETVIIRVHFIPSSSSPQFSIRWSKKGILLSDTNRITIHNEEEMSTLVIKEVMDCDNGKYDIEVSNEWGKDRNFTSLAVKGPPEPPAGYPSVTISSGTSLNISWSGSTYDGGSAVNSYAIEMKKDDSDWELITKECQNNSYTVKNLIPNSFYSFRICAINLYGISKAGKVSDSVKLISKCLLNEKNEVQNDKEFENQFVNIQKDVKFSELYDLKEEVGRGRFGVCKRVIELSTNREKAAKIIRCSRAKDREQVYQEVDIMNQMRHKHLLQLENAYELSREIILITEYISGGELFERIVADDYVLTEHECILFLRQICEGVSYMHKNNIMHLDLKPENILCKTRTSCDIKIIDFGLARKYTVEPLRVLFGTPEFVAPEVINYEPVSPKSDMWSIGIICYVMLSGLSPFMGENDTQTFTNVTQAELDFDDECFDSISQEAKDFISLLLVKRPEKRMTADECLDHHWLCLKEEPLNHIKLPTEKLKKFLIRRKWQKTGTAIRALSRIANLSLSKISCREVKEEPTTSDNQNFKK